MAGAPELKVFDRHGVYQAACKEPEAAAALMGFYGEGSTVRWGHSKALTLWTEGQDAGNSYDEYAAVMLGRMDTIREQRTTAREDAT